MNPIDKREYTWRCSMDWTRPGLGTCELRLADHLRKLRLPRTIHIISAGGIAYGYLACR